MKFNLFNFELVENTAKHSEEKLPKILNLENFK